MTKNKILGYAIGPIGAAAFGFITLPLITWFFSVEDVGRVSMLQVVTSFSVLLFCLGLDIAYVREYHEAENKPKLLKHSLLPGLILIVGIYGVIYLIQPTLIAQSLYEIPDSYLSAVSILCFILAFISRFLSLILRMEERAVAYSMSQLLPKILFLLFIIGVVWLGFKKDAYSLITTHAFSIAAVFFIFAWNTRKEWLASLKYKIKWPQLKLLLIFGLPLVVGGLASWGLNVMDKLFLRSMSTFAELGVYSVTMSIASVATIFAGVFNTIWGPLVFKWVKEGVDLKKVDEISEHVLAAVYFIVVFTGLFAWVLPYFLPKEYAAIEYLITLCLLAPLFYTLSETTAIGIAISRKTAFAMLASVGAMLINGIGNYLLVPKMGATGAAISTAFSFWIFFMLRTEFSRRVWRSIPNTKAYIITTLLVFTVIANAVFLEGSVAPLMVWFMLALMGLYIFRSTCFLAFAEVRKLVVR